MPFLHRLDITKIEHSLRLVQRDFDIINSKLAVRRDPMEDVIINNMVLGYRYLNILLDNRVNLLNRKGAHHILELNHIVLCGLDPQVRREHNKHIQATTDRFYRQERCNIGHIRQCYKKRQNKSPWKRAAAVYILHLSQPQLFFEGNHRTGALIMSSILVSEGKPPFVLGPDNARAYFNPSTLAKLTRKSVVTNMWKLPKIQKNFARFLKKQGQRQYLIEKN